MITFLDALQVGDAQIAFVGSEQQFLDKVNALPVIPRSSTDAEVTFCESPRDVLKLVYRLTPKKVVVWGFWSIVDESDVLRYIVALKNGEANVVFGEDEPLSAQKSQLLAELGIS